MNEEIVALEAINSSGNVTAQKSANYQAMSENVAEVAESSQGMEDAKEALNTSIDKMMSEPDPFMQMMIAIYEVVPGTMLYKEEKLLYDTDTFQFVTTLNNHMSGMMGYYAKAGDFAADDGSTEPKEVGSATSGDGDAEKWGLAAGDAYIQGAKDLESLLDTQGAAYLPTDLLENMNEALSDIQKSNSSALWNGLQGPYRELNGNRYKMTVGEEDMYVSKTSDGITDDGYSHSYVRTEENQGEVDKTGTANLELQTVVNSYSATVEAEYRFDMEQYNTYVTTDGDVMNAHIDQVGASANRLTNISHA